MAESVSSKLVTMRAFMWVAAGGLCGCLPVQRTVTVTETPLSSRTIQERAEPDICAQIEADGSGIDVRLESRAICRDRTLSTVERVEHRRREGLGAVIGGEYVLGIASLAAGGFIAYDSNTASPALAIGTPEQGANVGYALAGLGVGLVTLAIIESVRVRDHDVVQPPIEVAGATAAHDVACGTSPGAGEVVQLDLAGTVVVIGTTDASGQLRASWDVLPAGVLEGDRAPATADVLVQRAGSAGRKIGVVNIRPARVALGERAWQDAKGAATTSALVAFHTRFSELHPAETLTLLATRFTRDIEAALADRKPADARRLLDQWRSIDQSAPAQTTLGARIDELDREADIAARWRTYSERVAEARREPPTSEDLAKLAAELDALAALDPDHTPTPAALRDELSAIRKDAVKRLVADAERLRRADQHDIALQLATQASTIDPAARGPIRAAAKIRAEIATKGASTIRQLIRKKELARARRMLERVEALLPDEPRLASVKRELERAEARGAKGATK